MTQNNNNQNNKKVNAPRFTTLQALATLDAPVAYLTKMANDLLKADNVDASALRWHLDAVGLKVWGNKCVTWANAEKTALVVSVAEKAKKAEDPNAIDTIFALADAVKLNADALTSVTKARHSNADAVALNAAAADALAVDVAAFRKKAAERAEKAAERAEKVHADNVAALIYNGMAAADAEKAADTIRVIKGRKAENGLYCFKWAAFMGSFDYTFADVLTSARQAAAEKAAADAAAEKGNADAEKAKKAAEKAAADADAMRCYNAALDAVKALGTEGEKAHAAALAVLTIEEKKRVKRIMKAAEKANADAEKANANAALDALANADAEKVAI